MSYNRNATGHNEDGMTASSMARQAIINGNFDVWQRGTSLASLTDKTSTFLADRWFMYGDKDGGTPPTIAQSRQPITPGDIDGSMFFYRVSPNGAGSSFGNSMIYSLIQRIEHGTRALCGADRKVTLKFKARSSISNKKIGVFFTQYYGTGGSPSTYEDIAGTNWELTSSWADYEVTIDTNTLSGKTFGTNYDDWFSVNFCIAWGSTNASSVGASSAETWVGSGNIDIAQVQVCAGDVALPFEPKSYAEEYYNCCRYFYRIGEGCRYCFGFNVSTTVTRSSLTLPVPMRSSPTLITTGIASDYSVLHKGPGIITCSAVPTMSIAHNGHTYLVFTVASGLTAGEGSASAPAAAGSYLGFSAEL